VKKIVLAAVVLLVPFAAAFGQGTVDVTDRKFPPSLYGDPTSSEASSLPSSPASLQSRLDEALRKADRLQLENLRLRLSLQEAQLERTAAAIGEMSDERANILRNSVWTTKEITVSWENPSAQDAQERQWVREAVAETWERECGVRFVGWGTAAADARGIRIRINDEGPHCKYLGRNLDRKRDGMVLNFTYTNWCLPCGVDRMGSIKKIAAHEFGHALGFAHEQNRDDAPEWCKQERQGSNGDWYITLYDPSSIMNYCNSNWNNNGKLSALDIKAAKILYGDPASGAGPASRQTSNPLGLEPIGGQLAGGEKTPPVASRDEASDARRKERAKELEVLRELIKRLERERD
jgi:Astacin (Peptidase family M12A)